MDEGEMMVSTENMGENEKDSEPLWRSRRGMILVIGMMLYAYMVTLSAFVGTVNDTALLVFGGFVSGGGIYYFKLKSDEALKTASVEAK